jgi:DHA2 family multidrug resistance protein-like MFS transporter
VTTMAAVRDGARRAGRREWIGLAIIALPCLLYSMDLTVLNLAVPRLSADLRPTSAQLLWIVDIYGFVLASLLIPMGTLGDRIGRRKLLLAGAAAFGAASVLAAFARSAPMLIAARAVLGVAGATLAPSTLSLIRNMFPDDHQRSTAIGVWITSYSVGGALGPLLGGVLLERFWWGSVFLIAVPVMLLLLITGPLLLPEYRDPDARAIDVTSALLSLAAVLAFVYGMKRIASAGGGVWPFTSIVIGLTLGAAFVRRQRRLRDPLIDPALFASRRFTGALVAYTLATFAAFGIFLFAGQYLQLVKGLSPLRAGVASLPVFVGFIAGSFIAPVLARRISSISLMVGGFLMSAVGFAMLALAEPSSSLGMVITATSVYSLGLSPVFVLATDMIVGSAMPEKAGAASALSETGSELGGALGIGLLGSLGTAVYRHAMTHGMPAGVPSDAASAARNTIGGAMSETGGVSVAAVDSLQHLARVAFTSSMNAVGWLCVAVVILSAVGLALSARGAGDA